MKRRLSVENRMLIEQLLRLNYKLKDIAYYVDSTSSTDRKSTRLNSSHNNQSRMPSSA